MRKFSKLRIQVHANNIQNLAEDLFGSEHSFEEMMDMVGQIVDNAKAISSHPDLQVREKGHVRFSVKRPVTGNENCIISIHTQ